MRADLSLFLKLTQCHDFETGSLAAGSVVSSLHHARDRARSSSHRRARRELPWAKHRDVIREPATLHTQYWHLLNESPRRAQGYLDDGYALFDWDEDGLVDLVQTYISSTDDLEGIDGISNVFSLGPKNPPDLFDRKEAGSNHARKVLVADFNLDGQPDVFIADHGPDDPRRNFAQNILLLTDEQGKLVRTSITDGEDHVGYHHSAAAGDIDCDGDIDLIVTSDQPYFLINRGDGRFDREIRAPFETRAPGYFALELIDVDRDGFLDLIAGGHEHHGFNTYVFWGSSSGFSNESSTHIPSVLNYEIAIDFLFMPWTKDEPSTLYVARPRSDRPYAGFALQRVEIGASRTVGNAETLITCPGGEYGWIRWLYVQTSNDGTFERLFADRSSQLYELDLVNGDNCRNVGASAK